MNLDMPTHPAILLLPDTYLRVILFIPANQVPISVAVHQDRDSLLEVRQHFVERAHHLQTVQPLCCSHSTSEGVCGSCVGWLNSFTFCVYCAVAVVAVVAASTVVGWQGQAPW